MGEQTHVRQFNKILINSDIAFALLYFVHCQHMYANRTSKFIPLLSSRSDKMKENWKRNMCGLLFVLHLAPKSPISERTRDCKSLGCLRFHCDALLWVAWHSIFNHFYSHSHSINNWTNEFNLHFHFEISNPNRNIIYPQRNIDAANHSQSKAYMCVLVIGLRWRQFYDDEWMDGWKKRTAEINIHK